jgi:hypothetical protein
MKKLLGTTLALAMFVPAGANAELLKNFKVGGQLDIQTTSARNVIDFVTRQDPSGAGANRNDRIGHATTRVIVKMDWDLLDDVHSRVTLVKGAQGGTAGGAARTYGTLPAQTVQGIQDNTFVQEANVKIDKVFGALDVTAGRQFYGEEGDLVIYYGPRDDFGMRVDALDIFRADWNGEHMSVTGIAGKTQDGTITSTGGDAASAGAATDLRGLVVSCKMHEMVKPSIYLYNKVQHAQDALGKSGNIVTGGKNDNLWILGVKAKIAVGGLSLHLEVAGNRGEDRSNANVNTSYKGWAFLGKAAYKLDLSDLGMITPWGEYGYGTGDSNGTYAGNRNFQSINTDYRPGGIYGRFDNAAAQQLAGGTSNLASNGLSNRIIWGVGIKGTPTAINKLTVGAAFWRYAFNRLSDNGNASGTNPATRNSRNIGSEVNVTAEWKHSENVSLKATAGSFKPGAGIADIRGANAGLNPAVMLAGDVSIKF